MTDRVLRPDVIVESLEEWVRLGGGIGLTRARAMSPGALVQEIQLSHLRGRGGAGFPTGTKWSSVRSGGAGTRYAVCNAAEGEPGTFKDRAIVRANPYQVVEGLLIAAHAVGAETCFIALKASFERERGHLVGALGEMVDAGWIDRTIQVVSGPEEYLFGEEKALLDVIEGHEPLPRWLPPYLHGLFATGPQLGWEAHAGGPRPTAEGDAANANPTLVNNVETLANVTHIVANGPEWFRSIGTDASPGTVCCTVTGDVQRAGVVEVELGTPLRTVVDACGGLAPGCTARAVFSGVANAVLVDLDTAVSYEAMEAAGSGLGSAGFIVYDDRTCLVEVAAMLSRFLAVESCGQCPPCKLGTGAITAALDRIATGTGGDRDLDVIAERLRVVSDGNRCFLPVQEQRVVASILRAFPEDFAAHIETGRCPRPRDIPIPKIVDIDDGVVSYDPRQASKQPDWTYREA